MTEQKPAHLIVILTLLFFFCITAMPSMAQSDPSSTYAAINAAIKQGNMNEMVKYMSKSSQADIAKDRSKPEFSEEKIMKLLQFMAPVSYKVENQIIKEDKAVLELSGKGRSIFKPDAIEDSYGRVLFVKEDGQWKLDRENWNNTQLDKWQEKDLAPFKI